MGVVSHLGGSAVPLTLYAGVTPLGTLTYEDMDWPRYYFRFEPNPEFETFRQILDLRGSPTATEANMTAADGLDLSVVAEDGERTRMSFIFIDGKSAVIRQGFLKHVTPPYHDQFWRVLEEEVGPETCRQQGCARLKMRLSVFCKRHHFQMVMGE